MSLASDLRYYLINQATITTYTSTNRIYPVRIPASLRSEVTSRTAITYRRIAGGHGHDLSGSGGYAVAAMQLDCWSTSFEVCDKLAEAVRLKMQGLQATLGSTSTTVVKSGILQDEDDDFVQYDDGTDDGLFVKSLLYRILYTESVTTL